MMVAALGGGLIGWTLAVRVARGAEREAVVARARSKMAAVGRSLVADVEVESPAAEIPLADRLPMVQPLMVRAVDVPSLAPVVDFDVRTPAQQ
jgi:hypothetical protein